MFVKLIDGTEIELPPELQVQERIELCEQITKEHEESFTYVMPKNNKDPNHFGNQASMRLEILGTYILGASEKDKERPIISDYKAKRIAQNEINMSFLENKYDF